MAKIKWYALKGVPGKWELKKVLEFICDLFKYAGFQINPDGDPEAQKFVDEHIDAFNIIEVDTEKEG